MNNQFNAFKIDIKGQVLDDKFFFDYEDYDSNDETKPTYEQTVTKGKAFLQNKHLNRLLSQYAIPVYHEMRFKTEGTTENVPTDASIVVAYISIEPFLSTLSEEEAKEVTEDNKFEKASKIIEAMVKEAFGGDVTEYVYVRTITDRPAKSINEPSTVVKASNVKSEYLTLEKNDAVNVTVKHVNLFK